MPVFKEINKKGNGCDPPADRISKKDDFYFLMKKHHDAVDELENSFRFNDAVIRSLIIRTKSAITEPSNPPTHQYRHLALAARPFLFLPILIILHKAIQLLSTLLYSFSFFNLLYLLNNRINAHIYVL